MYSMCALKGEVVPKKGHSNVKGGWGLKLIKFGSTYFLNGPQQEVRSRYCAEPRHERGGSYR